MCFGGGTTYSPPNNPAPYSLDNSQSAVTETSHKNAPGSSDFGPEAAAKDAQDTKPTAPVTGYSITTGLNTATM